VIRVCSRALLWGDTTTKMAEKKIAKERVTEANPRKKRKKTGYFEKNQKKSFACEILGNIHREFLLSGDDENVLREEYYPSEKESLQKTIPNKETF
jgi:hypothetical protein